MTLPTSECALGTMSPAWRGRAIVPARPATLPRWLLVVLTLLAGTLWVRPAAAITCTLSGFSSVPTIPSTLYVRNNYPIGDPVFLAQLNGNFSCTGTSGEGVSFVIPSYGAATATLPAGLNYYPGDVPTPGFRSNATRSTGPCTAGVSSVTGAAFAALTTAGTCTGTFSVGIIFRATVSNPSGTIPINLPRTGGYTPYGSTGWVQAIPCGNPGCAGAAFFGPGTAGAGATLGPAGIVTLVSMTNSCSLSPSAATVVLPTVSRSAFNNVAYATAGRTPINLSLVCPSGVSAPGASVSLLFPSFLDTGSGVQMSDIATVSGTATGVGVRFYDSSGTPIQTNRPVSVATSLSAGTFPLGWSAGYVSTSATVSAGTLTATATVTVQYH